MLRKFALVTVIPATAGRDYRPATHQCYDVPPPGVGGETPPADSGGGTVTPAPGTVILLEYNDGTSAESVAPAPDGFVCRMETVYVSVPGSTEPAAVFAVVCAEG